MRSDLDACLSATKPCISYMPNINKNECEILTILNASHIQNKILENCSIYFFIVYTDFTILHTKN